MLLRCQVKVRRRRRSERDSPSIFLQQGSNVSKWPDHQEGRYYSLAESLVTEPGICVRSVQVLRCNSASLSNWPGYRFMCTSIKTTRSPGISGLRSCVCSTATRLLRSNWFLISPSRVQGDRLPLLSTTPAKRRFTFLLPFCQWLHLRSLLLTLMKC